MTADARTRSMAVDPGTASDAGDQATPAVRDRVRAVIVTILKERGPLTDDEIIDQYTARAGSHPLVPVVTPQRVRTARHGLVLDGLVHDTQAFGFSTLGNRATVWGLA
jgi:hypothetical protein